jgi:hypothetical protein
LDNNFEDLILANIPVFMMLRMNANMQAGGYGTSMVEPIMFPDASGGGPQPQGVTDPYAEITQSAMTGESAANYILSEYLIPVSVPNYQLKQQGSMTTKVDLIEGTFQNAVARFTSKLAVDLWADPITAASIGSRSSLMSLLALYNAGTAATTGGGTPDALAEQVGNRGVCNASTETLQTTIGGIQRAAAGAAYWCTPIIRTADTFTMQILSNIYSRATRNKDTPDYGVTTGPLFDKIQSLATLGGGNGGRFFSESKLADLGYDAVRWRNMEIVFDDYVPTTCYLNGAATQYGQNFLAINTKKMKLRQTASKPTFRRVDDPRPLMVWTGEWYGQITCKNPGRAGNARHVNLTP